MTRVPDSFVCPITSELMADPVSTSDGFTYEREAIEQWLASGHNTSPLTGEPLPRSELTPNHALRSAIEHFVADDPELKEQLYRPHDKESIQHQLNQRELAMSAQPIAGEQANASAAAVPTAMPVSERPAIVHSPVVLQGLPVRGLSAEDVHFAAPYVTPDWLALAAAPNKPSKSSGLFGRSNRGTSASGASDSAAKLPADLSVGVGVRDGGGVSLDVLVGSEAALLHIAARLAANGSAPVSALKLRASDGFGDGTLSSRVDAAGDGFGLLTRGLSTDGGSGCLAQLKELSISQMDVSCSSAVGIAAALRRHPSLQSLEMWNVKLKDEGALALGSLGAADGNFALSSLNLGRNLISGLAKAQIEALVDARRVELSIF
eukprot:CAMPEP_0183343416 /NCGR_PEP_ID=MMETSP0164_2-20130417/9339_1 /TAXON_ID=221442 /ORGANISM="Coccolithus pelagicus ssp braarudi, Strain PLY182g" /LENGTH=376 /DNA_ID=CAMNT_0025514233 /DNA_START=19 /DNA_END=1149 /DNA_ORIENTATION=-